ncbi:tripartite tricarboxylate transporter TctB family protein [Microlunatus soli]|uniref:Putative tricarboxylic transport membrane protein n=1 Tax=Microlunatus soli TaxID=630515 RepID=A0A1H1W9R5_9ACTN|nr:tripartite tricarboxylate transporter TctB family protein [Microlunatus soli]SDS93957.1 putative tricarboxylic transport membrane protein [Microlunatus soli]
MARSATAVGELIFAVAVAAAGGVVLVAAGSIASPLGASDPGPRAFPRVVGAFTLVIGILLVITVLRGHTGRAEESEDVDSAARTGWTTVGLLVAALVGHVFLIIPLGWPVAAAALFIATGWILGARRWRILPIGIALALIVQAVFGGLLGLSLPPGPLLSGLQTFGLEVFGG